MSPFKFYDDPTANIAIGRVTKEEKRKKRKERFSISGSDYDGEHSDIKGGKHGNKK